MIGSHVKWRGQWNSLLGKWTDKNDYPMDPRNLPGLGPYYTAQTLQDQGGTYLQAISSWPDLGPNGWHAVQATGANQPLFLPWSGENYLHLPGVAGNYISTPSSAAINAVLTDFTMTYRFGTFTAASGAVQCLLTKRNAAGTAALTQWQARLDATGELRLVVSNGTVTTFGGVSTTPLVVGAKWIKITFDADNGAGGSTTRFYYSTSTSSTRPTVWTQLGSAVTVASVLTAINATSIPVAFGALSDDGASQRFSGQCYLAEFANGIDGAAVIALTPSLGNANSTTVPDGVNSSVNWTVNRSAIGNCARIVSAPAVLFDGTQMFMTLPAGALGFLRNASGATMLATVSVSSFSEAREYFRFNNNAASSRALIRSLVTSGNISVGGRRLDADAFAEVSQAGKALNNAYVHGGRLDATNALAVNFLNGTKGTDTAWQTAGNFDNTDSSAIYLGGSSAGTFHAGTITNIAAYNVSLTDAQTRGLSRFLGVQSNTGIV